MGGGGVVVGCSSWNWGGVGVEGGVGVWGVCEIRAVLLELEGRRWR